MDNASLINTKPIKYTFQLITSAITQFQDYHRHLFFVLLTFMWAPGAILQKVTITWSLAIPHENKSALESLN